MVLLHCKKLICIFEKNIENVAYTFVWCKTTTYCFWFKIPMQYFRYKNKTLWCIFKWLIFTIQYFNYIDIYLFILTLQLFFSFLESRKIIKIQSNNGKLNSFVSWELKDAIVLEKIFLFHGSSLLMYDNMEATEPKWVNSILSKVGVNSLRLEGLLNTFINSLNLKKKINS